MPAWTVTVDGVDVRSVLRALQVVDGVGKPRPPRGGDVLLPDRSASVEVTDMPTGPASCTLGGLVTAATSDDLPAAITAWHSLARGATGLVTLAWAGLQARARWVDGGHEILSATAARVTADYTVLSDWETP